MDVTICAGDTTEDGVDLFCIRDEHHDAWHLATSMTAAGVQTFAWCDHCRCRDVEHLDRGARIAEGRLVELPDRDELMGSACRNCDDCPADVEDAERLLDTFIAGVRNGVAA